MVDDWSICITFTAPLATLMLDRVLGEPPLRVHPVVAMGGLLNLFSRCVPAAPPTLAFLLGTGAWFVGAALAVFLALVVQLGITGLTKGGSFVACAFCALLTALALKSLLSLRLLLDEVRAVERALAVSLEQGQRQVARICSRDTAALDASAVRETALESLAENLNDSVVAPLFWFAIAGLPGAALYRWANTVDAMWGYRTARWEWAGKFAARADDLLSWLPARITAALLAPSALGPQLVREARRTPSPNGGWPMAALALRLNIRLAKPGVYVLNDQGRSAAPADTARALKLAQCAAWAAALLAAGTAMVTASV